MCLHKLDFALKYHKGSRMYIGEGWKSLVEDKIPRKGRWHEAVGNWGNWDGKLYDCIEHTTLYDDRYHPGFHIFLNKTDALSYGKSIKKLVKVAFREVLGFGTNETYNSDSMYGPCVIARYMKVVEVLD